jgi:hypothetical protein
MVPDYKARSDWSITSVHNNFSLIVEAKLQPALAKELDIIE